MSSILDALERASQERMPGKADILPGSMPAPDTGRLVYRRLLVLVIVLISVVTMFWFLTGSESNKPVLAPQTEKASIPPATPEHSAPPIQTNDPIKERQDKPALPKTGLVADRIRSSSRPNQRPLVSEAILSEKQQRKNMPLEPPPVVGQLDEQTGLQESGGALTTPASDRSAGERKTSARPSASDDRQLALTQRRKQVVKEVESKADVTTQADKQQIPLIWEMDQGLRDKLEQLKTTIHVYNEMPSQRFVIINMKRYSEGDVLGVNDYRLHAIDRDGIVVDYGDGLVRLLREK